MPTRARVACPDCGGACEVPDDAGWPKACDLCLAGGHLEVDRLGDGTIPLTWPDDRPMVPWVDESEALFASLALRPNGEA